ncbi:GntT/GntP/DsdX family permease, partial [Aeromonas hydrophila]
MSSEVWVIATLLSSIVLIVVTIVKGKIHPFLALLLASFYVGTL